MKLQDALKKANELRPNQFTEETMVGWLSDLDGQIYRDILDTHEDAPASFTAYVLETDADTDLLVAFPDDGLYVLYLCAMIDWHNADYERYNNELLAFNTAKERYASAYNRAHLPLQNNSLSFWGTYEDEAADNPLDL